MHHSRVMFNHTGRYADLESKLWIHLGNEFMEASEILPVSSEDEDDDGEFQLSKTVMDPHAGDLLLGDPVHSLELRSQHPVPDQGLRLWQAFLDNVNPLTKIIHAPTAQDIVLSATRNPNELSSATEAFMFAIYSSAVCSLSNTECEKVTGQTRSALLYRLLGATRQALVNAGFLKTSNLIVLQAYTLFLFSMYHRYDSHSLWTLTGVALRIAQRMGLHRDGADLKLPPLETEIRRRLWWQILLLEVRAAEFSGV
ncbi:MAG: hypothetical protein Q9228_007870, partial [Teloschistes exilis]